MITSDMVKLRETCMALPDAHETHTWDHVQFRIRDKIFCGIGGYENEAVYVKVGVEAQGSFLQDPRFFKTPHIGQHGWVSTVIGGSTDWDELKTSIEASYERIARPKRPSAPKRPSRVA